MSQRTKLKVFATNNIISQRITAVTPKQDITEIRSALFSGEWHVQTVGKPRKIFDLEFLVLATQQEAIDDYAATKLLLLLERHNKNYMGIISGDPEWRQEIGSANPEKALYRCKVLFLVMEG